jgi:hypothetical protein
MWSAVQGSPFVGVRHRQWVASTCQVPEGSHLVLTFERWVEVDGGGTAGTSWRGVWRTARDKF